MSKRLGFDHLYHIGLTRRDAADRFGEAKAMLPQTLRDFSVRHAREFLLLDTCERIELYFVAEEEHVNLAALPGWFPGLAMTRGTETMEHFLSVALGIKSRIVGEKNIRQQVRKAVLAAEQSGSLGPCLFKLGQAAIRLPRRVSRECRFGEGVREIHELAIESALDFESQVESLDSGRRTLVIGTGCIGKRVIRDWKRHDADITVASPTPGRASTLAEEMNIAVLEWTEVTRRLSDFRFVFVATGQVELEQDSHHVSRSPQFLCDFSMPRVVGRTLAEQSGVAFWDLDRLASRANAQLEGLEQAQLRLEQELERLRVWDRNRGGAEMADSAIALTSKETRWLCTSQHGFEIGHPVPSASGGIE